MLVTIFYPCQCLKNFKGEILVENFRSCLKSEKASLPINTLFERPSNAMNSVIFSIGDVDFDFNVAIGGTALANRPTADPNVSVVIIEAGSYRLRDPKSRTPRLATTLYDDPT